MKTKLLIAVIILAALLLATGGWAVQAVTPSRHV
jgi:hypothetical protein